MTDVEPHDEQSFGDKAKTWAISALGWLIVAALVFFAIDWLFSTLAIAFKAVFSLAIVGLMIFGYFKLRHPTLAGNPGLAIAPTWVRSEQSLRRRRKCHPGCSLEGLPIPCAGEEAATSDVHHDRL